MAKMRFGTADRKYGQGAHVCSALEEDEHSEGALALTILSEMCSEDEALADLLLKLVDASRRPRTRDIISRDDHASEGGGKESNRERRGADYDDRRSQDVVREECLCVGSNHSDGLQFTFALYAKINEPGKAKGN